MDSKITQLEKEAFRVAAEVADMEQRLDVLRLRRNFLFKQWQALLQADVYRASLEDNGQEGTEA